MEKYSLRLRCNPLDPTLLKVAKQQSPQSLLSVIRCHRCFFSFCKETIPELEGSFAKEKIISDRNQLNFFHYFMEEVRFYRST